MNSNSLRNEKKINFINSIRENNLASNNRLMAVDFIFVLSLFFLFSCHYIAGGLLFLLFLAITFLQTKEKLKNSKIIVNDLSCAYGISKNIDNDISKRIVKGLPITFDFLWYVFDKRKKDINLFINEHQRSTVDFLIIKNEEK